MSDETDHAPLDIAHDAAFGAGNQPGSDEVVAYFDSLLSIDVFIPACHRPYLAVIPTGPIICRPCCGTETQ